ncbi:MAG: hypothetical protein Fur0037_12380 [Planctomycetota bacterium]
MPWFVLLACVVFDPFSLPAQEPQGRVLGGITRIHTAPADPIGGDYGTWAAGDDYKVSFHDGMTFIPYLGRTYPVTRRITWRTLSGSLGSVDLLGGDPVHGHDDLRYEYRFAQLTEAYDVRAEGLEQTFVVREKIEGSLRIEGELGGNLRPVESGDRIAFVDDSGVVLATYERPVAVDAHGRRFAVDAALVGSRLSLGLDEAGVASAEFPLVIDPLLATNLVGSHGTADPDSVDVAREDTTNRIAVAYLRHVSAVDQDAWIREFTDGFGNAPGGDLVFTDINSWGIQNIRICNVGPAHDWVAVVNRALPAVHLRYWVQPCAAAVLNTTVTAAASVGGANQWNADIGGVEAFDESGVGAVGTAAMCVYMLDYSSAGTGSDTTEIWAQRVDVAGAGVVPGPQFQVAAGGDNDQPSITKVSDGRHGGPARWIAVWQRYDSPDPMARDWDVVGTQVFENNTSSGLFEANGSHTNLAHRLGPKVEGQRGRYLVAFGEVARAGIPKNAAFMGQSMVAQRFDWPDGGAVSSMSSRTFHGPGIGQQMIIADVAYDSDTDSQWTILDLDIVDGYMRAHRCGYTGRLLEEVAVSGVPVGSTHNGLGGACYDDDSDRFVLAYGDPTDLAGNPVYGRYLIYPTESPTILAGPTCRPILPRWEGRDQDGTPIAANDQQIGNQFGHLMVGGTPAGSLHFMLLSTATAFVPIVNPSVGAGCIQLVDMGAGYLGSLPGMVGGSVEWNVPLPGFLSPFTLHTQDVYLDPTDNRIYTTYRLSVPVVK